MGTGKQAVAGHGRSWLALVVLVTFPRKPVEECFVMVRAGMIKKIETAHVILYAWKEGFTKIEESLIGL